jgi:hypothetical protein
MIIKMGAASGRAGGLAKGALPWSTEYPQSHVRQLNAPRGRGTSGTLSSTG